MGETDKSVGERRRLELYRLIASEEITTRKALAEHLKVKARTINYDIDKLEERWGVIIEKKEGSYDYKIIDHGELAEFRDVTMVQKGKDKSKFKLTERQVSLILASLTASRNFMPTEIGIVQEGLYNTLSDQEAKKLRRLYQLNDRPLVDDQNIFNNIEKVRRAIVEEKKIEIRYTNSDDVTKTRIVTPYSLACDIGKYYIIGKPDGTDRPRHFRMDRIKEIAILHKQKGTMDGNFNINEYMKKTWYMQGGDERAVIVKFKDAADTFKVVTERNMQVGRVLEHVPGDYFIYEFITNGINGIIIWLMGFGANAQVLEPWDLRERIKKAVKDMYDLYELDGK